MRQTRHTPIKASLFISLLLTITLVIGTAMANTPPLTISEVAKDLACPCQCPLILQDCNMSCGLRWKEEIGEQIAKGKTKQEIIEHFISTQGESARLTPLQKIQGKI